MTVSISTCAVVKSLALSVRPAPASPCCCVKWLASIEPTAGEITFPCFEREEREPRLGVMFQDGALFSTLTVLENVEAPLREHTRLSPAASREIAGLKLSMAGLGPDSHFKRPAQISGGMRKRASVARAIALDPELLFLDEPTAGLDPISAEKFDRMTEELARSLGLTVFLVTHDLDTLHAICDRVAVLYQGKVAAIGTIPEITANAEGWVKEYFSGPRGRAAEPAPREDKSWKRKPTTS